MSPRLRATPKTAPVQPRQPWNTLQKLWASLYLIWALDALLLMSAIIGAQVHREAMKGVGKDSAPSIIHAQDIKAAMADMDANAANELLTQRGELRKAALKEYEKERKKAATALIEAAKNITYGKDEQDPIEAIQIGLGTFEGLIQKARDLHDEEDAGFVSAYREAAMVLDDEKSGLYKQADNLDQANDRALTDIYNTQKGRSIATVFLILAAASALFAALAGVQKFLNQQMHRILNPPLILTTLVTLGFVLYTLSLLSSERHQLKVAKEDAFTSIHALWRARAVAYAANSDESRYLLDTAHAQDHEAAFFAKVAKLANLEEESNWENAEISGAGLKGYLGDELNNITFEGERTAALTTVTKFREYLKIDKEIRRRQRSGKHAEAVELCIGTAEGESNWAFDQFDQALGETLDINQKAFDAAVEGGLAALSNFELKASIVTVVIALLAFFGLLKRIREYA